MKRLKNLSFSVKLNSILILTTFIITIYFVITGPFIREGFQINVGDVADRLFTATRQVENRIETERRREEAYNSVGPRFKIDTEITETVIKNLDSFFSEIRDIRESKASELQTVSNIYDMINAEESEDFAFLEPEPEKTLLPIDSYLVEIFDEEQIRYIINLDDAVFERFEEVVRNYMNLILDSGLRAGSMERTLLEIKEYFEGYYIEIELSHLGYEILAEYIKPNQIDDEELMQTLRREAMENVEPVVLLRGEEIVREGQRITEEAYQILEDLGLIAKDSFESLYPILGVCLLVIVIFSFVLYYINMFNKEFGKKNKEVLLLFSLYMIVIISAKILTSLPFVFIPILAVVMLLGLLTEYRLSLILNIAITLIVFLIIKGDVGFIVYFMITGIIMALISRYSNQRSNLFVISLIISTISAVAYASISVIVVRSVTNEILINTIYAFGFGIFTVIICIGSLPLWEAVFGIITPTKLLELTNPNNPLLKRLAIEAPGTYHHSVIVANLAEAAANDIGADSNIARVGGYFQDIGKLRYPQYFVENQAGKNPHDTLQPYSSAKIIMNHVDHGLKLAEKHKLPKVIKDIIAEHHGTTLVKYFYLKAKEAMAEEDIDENDFQYKHSIPQSREAAVVMLADTVEAAVRSMFSKSKTMDEIENFVKKLIKDKLDTGQLKDSGFMVKDLDTVAESFMRVFKGMYHERIPYPEEKRKNED